MTKKKGKNVAGKKPDRFPKSENDPKDIRVRLVKAVNGARKCYKGKARSEEHTSELQSH